MKHMGHGLLRVRRVAVTVALVRFLSGGLSGANEPVPRQDSVSAPPVVETPAASSSAPGTGSAPMTGSAGSTLPAAKPPATVVLPRAILGATGVELLHPETGQLLARVPLRARGAAFFQRGDFFYVAHQNSFSIVNLRTEVVREIKLSLSPTGDGNRERIS